MRSPVLLPVLILAACHPGGSPLEPLCGTPADSGRLAVFDPSYIRALPHYYTLAEGESCARRQGKGLMLYFTSINARSGYGPEKNWFGDPALLRRVNRRFVPVYLFTDRRGDSGAVQLYEIAHFGTAQTPALIFTTADGQELGRCMDPRSGALEKTLDQLPAAP